MNPKIAPSAAEEPNDERVAAVLQPPPPGEASAIATLRGALPVTSQLPL